MAPDAAAVTAAVAAAAAGEAGVVGGVWHYELLLAIQLYMSLWTLATRLLGLYTNQILFHQVDEARWGEYGKALCELYMYAGSLGAWVQLREVCVARRKHVVCSQAFAPLTKTCDRVVWWDSVSLC